MASGAQKEEKTPDISLICEDTYKKNIKKAKLKSSLEWLLSIVYGKNVPFELRHPFDENTEGQIVLHPKMTSFMCSAELYSWALANIFPGNRSEWTTHWSNIHELSKKGVFLQDDNVTETVLLQNEPIKLDAHLVMIDAIMTAYKNEVASTDKVMFAIRSRGISYSPLTELNMTTDDALVHWINMICQKMQSKEVERVKTGKTGKSREEVPLLENLVSFVGTGCSLGAVLAYYKPKLLSLKDFKMNKNVSISESIQNLYKIKESFLSLWPWKAFHLCFEDLIYADDSLWINITTFIADLFFCLEGPWKNANEKKSANLWTGNTLSSEQESFEVKPSSDKIKQGSKHKLHEDTSNESRKVLKTTKGTGKAVEIISVKAFNEKCDEKNVEHTKKVDLLNLSVIDLTKKLNEEKTQHQVTKEKLSEIKSELTKFSRICLETTCPICKLTYNSQENSPLMLPNGVSVCWKCANEFPEKELLRFTKDVMIHDGTSGLFYNTAFLNLIERLQQNFLKFP
uniref:Uncharacterized protein n=1 Tax=Biomphalaria glabrata TaxID=6526 RepID=A0A2C9L7Z1_BIOGL